MWGNFATFFRDNVLDLASKKRFLAALELFGFLTHEGIRKNVHKPQENVKWEILVFV